jgi:signal transduction histidine kinase
MDAIRESARGEWTLVLRTAGESPATVRVAVRDSGTGIDEAELDRIFQAFYTTRADGLGMGLAMARSIVEAHGRRLEAHNSSGGGATFPFALPVRNQES